MSHFKTFLLSTLILVCLLTLVSGAADKSLGDLIMDANQEAIANQDKLLFSSAKYLGSAGVTAYWMVYGEWPDDFQQVRNAGFVQVELKSVTQEPVDLDDGSFDFRTDCHYFPPSGSSEPRIAVLRGIEQENVVYDTIEQQDTYENLFAAMPQPMYEKYAELLSDEGRMQLVGIANVCSRGLLWYKFSKGSYPQTWDEFIDSGYCPVNHESINPLTGEKLFADGRADNLLYSYKEQTGRAMIFVSDANGEIPWRTNW